MDVSQYLDIFIDETNGHIQALNDNIMILEKEPENKDVINEIFRAAHSLKGMAGTMGSRRCSDSPMIWKMYFRRSAMTISRSTAT